MFKGFCTLYGAISIFGCVASAATNVSMCRSFYQNDVALKLAVKPAQVSKIHEELTETLYIGIPITVKPFSANGNKNPLWLVTLENPKTKQKIKALFKPRNFGDGDGWNRVPMEYVSYGVARLLDMDIIPPVAYRRNLTLNGQFFYEGSMQYFVEGATLLKEIDRSKWNLNSDEFISNARVLDILLQNPDRHAGNFIFGPHWVDGVSRPLLIDQAANLRKGTNMRLSTKGPFNDKMISHFDPKTVRKLRALDEKRLRGFFPFITKDEALRILNHRDGIVSFIDSRSSGK